jgi:hypothetical protein
LGLEGEYFWVIAATGANDLVPKLTAHPPLIDLTKNDLGARLASSEDQGLLVHLA